MQPLGPCRGTDLTVALDVDEASGVVSASQMIASLESGSQAELIFTVDVDAEYPDNSYLPVIVDVSDASSR